MTPLTRRRPGVTRRQQAHPPRLPALVVGRVVHHRLRPVRHVVDHRHYAWLVDLDDLPRLRGPLRLLADFRAEDHLDGGALGGGIGGDVTRFLARHGIHRAQGDRLIMLAHPRSLGHGFNPLSVHWCLRADGQVRAVVLEVHNTYRQRHAYLLRPGADGRAEVGKEFYVSPFNDLDGSYAVRLRLEEEVVVAVRLDVAGQRVLQATLHGRARPASTANVLRAAALMPLMTHRVSALIRLHGIWLWLRRLPVRPRPEHDRPDRDGSVHDEPDQ